MRSVKVEYQSGRELFEAYWNFLQSGGVVLRKGEGFADGEPVTIVVRIRSVKKQWSFASRVARVAPDGRVFVAFDPGQGQDQMVNSAWADTYLVPERRHRRYDVRADVRYFLDGRPQPATLTNLSRGGCCIETDERLPVGTRLTVTGPDLEATASVRWVKRPPSRELGLEFVQPIDGSSLIP